MTQTCPSCAQPAAGRFCSNCGTRLGAPETCAECAAEILQGARFCNMCGASVVASPAPPPPAAVVGGGGEGGQWRNTSRLPWYIAGLALVALATVILVFGFRSERVPAPAAFAAPTAASDAQAVDLSSMTPREAADRLFDRIMRSVSAGDTAQARAFLPMAFGAYERVGELDADARYHLGVLHLLAGEPASARAEADAILAADPTHLFGLFTAAQAERDLGNTESARNHYRRFLEVYAAEIERNLPEYQAHMPALPQMRAEAQAFAASGP